MSLFAKSATKMKKIIQTKVRIKLSKIFYYIRDRVLSLNITINIDISRNSYFVYDW